MTGAGDRAGPRDEGNAVVEFIYLSVVLMIPLVYVLLGVFDTQRASFGVTEAARQAGRTWITSGCDRDRAAAAARLALADQGVQPRSISIPGGCPGPGGRGTVVVSSFVQLRGAGALLPSDRGGFEVSGRFVAVRDRFVP